MLGACLAPCALQLLSSQREAPGRSSGPSLNHLRGDRRAQLLLGSSVHILLSASPVCSHTPSPASSSSSPAGEWSLLHSSSPCIAGSCGKRQQNHPRQLPGLGPEHHKCAAWMFYHLLKEWPWLDTSAHGAVVLLTNLLHFPFLVVGCSSLLIAFPCGLWQNSSAQCSPLILEKSPAFSQTLWPLLSPGVVVKDTSPCLDHTAARWSRFWIENGLWVGRLSFAGLLWGYLRGKNSLKTQQVAKNDGVCSTAVAVLLHFRAGGTGLWKSPGTEMSLYNFSFVPEGFL